MTKRMPTNAVEAERFAELRRRAGRSEQVRAMAGVRPITLAPTPWSKDASVVPAQSKSNKPPQFR